MIFPESTIGRDVRKYCAEIGANPLLIQGAGGNVSWKDSDILWVKASGTWLSRANDQDIFVPLVYSAARELAESGLSTFASCLVGESTLRPSIETALHALLPQSVVMHCHAIDIIAHSAMQGGQDRLRQLLQGISWAWVDYVKPGPELAMAVAAEIRKAGTPPDLIVLANHGLVVAGADISEVNALLDNVLHRTNIEVSSISLKPVEKEIAQQWRQVGYERSFDALIQQLAKRDELLQLVQKNWVLYPDHAVFLGADAVIFDCSATPAKFISRYVTPPVCVIVPCVDVMISNLANNGQRAMIKCYADIAHRLAGTTDVVGLTCEQIAELLDWDAEKYRQHLNEQIVE